MQGKEDKQTTFKGFLFIRKNLQHNGEMKFGWYIRSNKFYLGVE